MAKLVDWTLADECGSLMASGTVVGGRSVSSSSSDLHSDRDDPVNLFLVNSALVLLDTGSS